MSRSQKKNARKKQKKKEKASELLFQVEEIISGIEQASLSESGSADEPSTATQSDPEVTVNVSSDGNLKRIRMLRKKIKQITELEKRIASGEITHPDADQINKVAKKESFLKELEELMTN